MTGMDAHPSLNSGYSTVCRILDTAANRAREALRVLEDYARLALADVYLSRSLKAIRHQIAAALSELNSPLLLASRDIDGDVGTRITGAGEYQRQNLADVVGANAKRLQEALRSLEEFSKTQNAAVARTFEALRYESYALEQSLLRGATSRQRLADVRLYWLTPPGRTLTELEHLMSEAIAGGVQMVQLREKAIADRKLIERARLARQVTLAAGVPLIINDRADITVIVRADGVHLGQDDLTVADARRILPPDALIGVSTHSLEQVHRAVRDGASYIGVGPTFPSSTKEFTAYSGLGLVTAASRETSLPAFVLGGVTAENVGGVLQANGRRIAISAAVDAGDPRRAAQRLRTKLDANPMPSATESGGRESKTSRPAPPSS